MNAPAQIERSFLPPDFKLRTWSDIEPFFLDLRNRPIDDEFTVRQWLRDLSEVEAYLFENMAWRYIRMSTDTQNEEKRKAFHYFVNEIQPETAPFFDEFNRKLISTPVAETLAADPAYAIYLRNTKKSIEIFRSENIALDAEMTTRSQDFGGFTGKMTVSHDGKDLTMPQAAALLEQGDRDLRKTIFHKIADRRMQDKVGINNLLDDLIKLRHQIAENAGFASYRDYMFAELKRFDYNPRDCYRFHESVEKVIVPMVSEIHEARKKALGIDSLQPYDLSLDYHAEAPLAPFKNGNELIEKGIEVLRRVHPFFAECLRTMDKMGHLDLESRNGKAPGGYNYPLYDTGYPFIFMNAAGTQNDLMTFVHESGHAVHSVLTQELELTAFKNCPSELAELASMSMELLSMQHWNVFYSDPEELRRAQLGQLERAVSSLTWIATIDCFQHWLYENPDHSHQQRAEAWREIYTRFQPDIDWSGLEEYCDHHWQKQLHLFEVPFYYIEYGMAQLGAIAVYRNFVADPEKALQQYTDALKLGNCRSIPEVYEAAGIRFDFSADYIRELAEFVSAEIEKLKQ